MVRPQRHSRPGYGSPGESTHNCTALLTSNRLPINRRHTNRRKSPMSGYFYYCRLRAGIPCIYTGGTASLHWTLLYIGWPEQSGHTIHFPTKVHTNPSLCTLNYPSTDQIHCYFHNTSHINVTINNSGNSQHH